MPRVRSASKLIYTIARAHRLLNAGLEAVLPVGMSVEQWRVIEKLSDREGCGMGDLANAVLMNHPALTKMIDRMVADGLVHRAPDEHDQRRVLVYLTDRGLALFRRTRLKVQDYENDLARAIGNRNARQLESQLTDIATALESEPSEVEQS